MVKGSVVLLKISNAESYLKDKIGENSNDVARVWEVFKSFAKEQVIDEEETAILFQCGVYDFTGEELFYYDFVRQFTNGEDEPMEQLHCEFVFKPTNELKKLKTTEWYFDTDGDINDFFTNIGNLEEFKIPLKSTPIQLSIYQEEIG